MAAWLSLGAFLYVSVSLLVISLTAIVGPDPLVVPHLKGAEQCGYVDVGELAARDEEDDCRAEWWTRVASAEIIGLQGWADLGLGTKGKAARFGV